MPADEETRGSDAGASRARNGPRHAAPRKPLFTRFHMPAGKAIALAAMPTAVLMGMGFTPTLALADGNDASPAAKSLTADEYKECVAALEGAEQDGSPSPTPSASAGAEQEDEAGRDDDGGGDDGPEGGPTDTGGEVGQGAEDAGDVGNSAGTDGSSPSTPDSGSGDEAGTAPSARQAKEKTGGAEAPAPAPSASESRGGLLKDIGDALEDLLTGGAKAGETPAPGASASGGPSQDASAPAEDAGKDGGKESGKDGAEAPGTDGGAGTGKETAGKDTAGKDTAGKTGGGSTGPAEEPAAEEPAAQEPAEEPAEEATPSPTPTPTATETPGKDLDGCPLATDARGGVDNTVPLPDGPWYLNASSLLLKGASYQGIVEVRTANGTTKKVLKYVISQGTDIGDLHQTVKDDQSGRTYHVQAAKGSTSTIRDGRTVMYTESISGNLLGLIPVTFDPEHPPPLDIPLIYFTKVTVVQAGQFGGTLHIPGLHQYTT
ncbi:hypothetical protein [Streptomyces tagetis]|uniref:Membrane-bound hydrophilic protein n=1 Tax=Streptomyces tagetis TaxID=2820809 RepID=A0A941B3D9_9ACTN|nr:hypothetical protein [Streptomyces sp. RG38]MBQ0828117.1 hypothetical protein [Streptomyces sp. RG38]